MDIGMILTAPLRYEPPDTLFGRVAKVPVFMAQAVYAIALYFAVGIAGSLFCTAVMAMLFWFVGAEF